MPRPKKGSPEAKAWGAAMKAARQQKQPTPTSTQEPVEEIVQEEGTDVLEKRIAELESLIRSSTPPPPAQQMPSTKTVITKYSFDPKAYPDPIPRIIEYFETDTRLKRFGLTNNWKLTWEVQKVDYEEDGLKVRAPRFVLELWGKVFDDNTGKITKEYLRKRGMFFEDPDSYIAIANQMGIEVPEYIQKDFLDEMRYLSIRDWLIESFIPPISDYDTSQLKQEVIGNRLVKVMEIGSEQGSRIPFEQLRNN